MGTIEISVKGHLDRQWTEWLGGLSIEHQADGTSLLSGSVADLPALFGLLNRVRDLGLTLLWMHYAFGILRQHNAFSDHSV